MGKKYIIIISILIFVLVIFFFISPIHHSPQAKGTFSDLMREDEGVSDTLNCEYMDLFSESAKKRITNKFSHSTKVRNSFGNADYDTTYTIIIYKMQLAHNSPVNEIINEKDSSVKPSNYISYGVDNQQYFELLFKAGKVNLISNILLTLDDNEAEVLLKCDSAAYYYLPKGVFSIKYGIDSAVDILIFHTDNFAKSLMFLKRDNSLFFLMMFPIKQNAILPKNLLYSLIK